MTPFRPALALAAALLLPLGLAGCEQLGIEDPAKVQAAKEAEGKAIGSACRHALRAIEDCYTLNPKAHKASVFAGWREMDEYMRENKIEGIVPVVPRPVPGKPASASEDGDKAPEKDAAKESKDGGKDSAKDTKAAKAKPAH
ncbi:hypothetical protein [Roseateles koreensis]|uniref:Uncharacterized protein n=1 Tax=Roseateles koreensis TaxID=2987526 RepID=A0ABT5KNU0_9BURK|nr:hypothetical protein [Roseateles koreensis]MDC8784590.1 hypothetical protein [Roseateles koreensis]